MSHPVLPPVGSGALPHGLKVNLSFAAFPASFHIASARRALLTDVARTTVMEPAWGDIWAEHVQLVPQNAGLLNEDLARLLRASYPHTQFRLHANVRVMERMEVVDVSEFHLRPDWIERAAAVSRALHAPAYSAHSGLRKHASFDQMLRNACDAAAVFGVPVAIEGQYPQNGDPFWVSSWCEYEDLMRSGVPFVVDLSHLNILVHVTGERRDDLVADMLASQNCLEVHVSSNDGSGDHHQQCKLGTRRLWWWPLLQAIHPKAVVFTEGNQLRQRLVA